MFVYGHDTFLFSLQLFIMLHSVALLPYSFSLSEWMDIRGCFCLAFAQKAQGKLLACAKRGVAGGREDWGMVLLDGC